MTSQSINRYTATVKSIEKFFKTYMAFPEECYSLVCALWTIATFVYPDFDAFPYMVISSDTKRSGKTRLAEVISFVCSNPVNTGALTPAAIYNTLAQEQPTLFFDEAETLDGEAANAMRSILNMGYRKGSVVRRMSGKQIMEYPVYSPKCFILIGDVYDTLHDRSIVLRMRRAEPSTRFVYEPAKAEGASIRENIARMIEEEHSNLLQRFMEFKGIEFLTDRDEEIWTPLFVVCQHFCPERLKELTRAAVDMSTEKTQDRRRYVDLLKEAEGKAQSEEYEVKLLKHMGEIVGTRKYISTADALGKLWEMETAPWRKFRGDGLTMHNLSDMLSRFGVRPCNNRDGKKVVKGYKASDIKKALSRI